MKFESRITVCVPCHNSAKYIKTTIESILQQEGVNFNIIVIDNNSNDETFNILKRFKDPRIKVYRNKRNIGMFQNMNLCIKLSNAQYIKIVCSDDVLHKDALRRQSEILDRYKDVALVYNASNIVNDRNKILFDRTFFKENRKINGGVLINQILKSGRNPIGEPTVVMFRRSITEKYKLRFNKSYRYIADLELWVNILKYGNGYYINEKLSSFRIHKNSSTLSLFKKAIQEHVKLTSIYADEFNLTMIDQLIVNLRLFLNLFIKTIFLRIFA